MKKEYVNWHSHSHGSLLDGASKPEEYAEKAKELGMDSFTFTDHGNIHTLLDAHDAATKVGLKFFPGQEFYQARKTRFDRDPDERAGPSRSEWDQRGPYHMGVVAYNNAGYHNLIKLSSKAFLEGYFVKPRVDHELLSQHSEGLVLMSGCLSSEIQQALLRDDFDFALKTAATMQDIVGKDNYFIELQNHGIPEELKNHKPLIEIARLINAPIIPTCDSHYTHQEDSHHHDLMLCQPQGTQVKTAVTPSKKGLEPAASVRVHHVDKNIEDIKVGDRVVSWNASVRRGNIKVAGDLVTDVGSREYKGKLISVTLPDGTTSSYTHDHICIARLDSISLRDKYIVYLMRKGNRFRVGSTGFVRNASNTLGIAKRSKENGADAAWILGVFESEEAAKMHEELTSLVFHIPTWTFKASVDRPNHFNAIWEFIEDNRRQALHCLYSHGRDIKYPLWTKDIPLYQRVPIEIRACNLIDGVLMAQFSKINNPNPSVYTTYQGSGCWQEAKVSSAPYEGTVYSIEVEKTHTYIADDIVTHNCINTGSRVDTENRFKFSGDHFYLKSYDEMASLFPEEYLKNTLLIRDKYDLDLKFDEYHFPQFAVPDGKTTEQYFDEMVYMGARKRFGIDWKQDTEVYDRVNYEMGVIKQMGFPNYFLVVADIVNWCKRNNIMVGPGRGSAAGSIVSYCLRITEVDPLKYGLPFERFLVPGRKSMPDIDLDIDDRFREDAIAYTRERYGYDHTCQIVTFGEMGAKKAVRDVARVLNYPFELGDKISKAMPPAVFGVSKDLDECLSTKEFRDLYETDTDVKTIVDSAKKLEGLWRDVGIHAAGLVIADKPIIEYIPVMQKGEGKPIVSQWDMHKVEQCGLLKIDFLGLRNLSIISMCLDMIKDTKGVEIKEPYRLLEEEDPAVYAALGRGENIGVFQVESEGIRELLIGMKPSSLEDISAILSLYRPGPMGSNVHNEYIERKHGRKPITAVHPVLKELLKDTYGLLLYQEQLLKIATDVAGFSIGEADDLRKAVGKKIKEKMQGLKSDFIDGCEKKQIVTRQQAEKLFAEIEHHASYSFSKNHAVSYGFTTYLTSYLRTHYPTEYMAAALSTVQDKKERLRLYLNECRRLGISVLPPSVNYSEFLFKVKSDTEIVYGFSAIKGVGEVIANQMVATRTSEYVSLFDFLRSVDNSILNKKVLEHFAAAGCFDDLLLLTDIDCDDLTRSQRMEILYGESEELGVFLSDHPFAEVSDLVLDKATHTISQVNENITGQMVKVGGVVVNVDKIITKAGKKMYKVYLEDMEGSITVTIFPTAALKLPDPPFEKGDIAIITGKIERGSEDENSTITLVFFDFEKISTQHLVGGRPIFLKTDKPVSYKRIKQMSDIISNTNGNSPVFLEYAEDGRQITLRFKELTSKSTEESLRFLLEVNT